MRLPGPLRGRTPFLAVTPLGWIRWERLRLLQIERVEPFGEPTIDWSEKLAGFFAL
jgi:hypothetical protein